MPQGSIHWQGTQRRACGPGAHWNVQVYFKLPTRTSNINISLRIYSKQIHFLSLINTKFTTLRLNFFFVIYYFIGPAPLFSKISLGY